MLQSEEWGVGAARGERGREKKRLKGARREGRKDGVPKNQLTTELTSSLDGKRSPTQTGTLNCSKVS